MSQKVRIRNAWSWLLYEQAGFLPIFSRYQDEKRGAANQSYFFKNFKRGRTRFFILVLEMKSNRTENHPVYSNNVREGFQ